MTSNEKLCENLRHGIYFDGYDLLSDKTNGIMKEGAARIKRQAAEIESLTAERDRLRAALKHPLLNQVLGDIEDSDANGYTWGAAMAWIDLRDDVLKGA